MASLMCDDITLECQLSVLECLVHEELAQIVITQEFRNQNLNEGLYIFPVHSLSRLSDLRVILEDRQIVAEILELEEAKQRYADAISSGQKAVIGNYSAESVDLMTFTIGNFQNSSIIKVRVIYTLQCKYFKQQNQWSLHIPQKLFSRYGNYSDTHIYRPPLESLAIIQVKTTEKITDFSTNTENSTIQHLNDFHYIVKLGTYPNLDILVQFSTSKTQKPVFLIQKDLRTQKSAMYFSFHPQREETKEEQIYQFILLLDRSGSMDGRPISLATQAVNLFIKSLPERCLFNIVSFGTHFQKLFPQSQPYTMASINQATQAVKLMDSDMGGTEILKPLVSILKQRSSYPIKLFILTDGGVSNTKSVISKIKENSQRVKVSTIGIGNGVSTALVEGAAQAGKGTCQIILNPDGIRKAVVASLKQALVLGFSNIRVLNRENFQLVFPQNPITGFFGDKIRFSCILKEDSRFIQVGYYDQALKKQEELTVEIDKSYQVECSSCLVNTVGKIFQEENRENQIKLSVKYQVLSKYTGFLGVEKIKQKEIYLGGLQGRLQSQQLSSSQEYSQNCDQDDSQSQSSSSLKGGKNMKICRKSSSQDFFQERDQSKLILKQEESEPDDIAINYQCSDRESQCSSSKSQSPLEEKKVIQSLSKIRKSRNLSISSEKAINPIKAPQNPSAYPPIDAFIDLQYPDGHWQASSQLGSLLFPFFQVPPKFFQAGSPLVTAILIAIFSQFYNHFRDEWELVILKAKNFCNSANQSILSLSELKEILDNDDQKFTSLLQNQVQLFYQKKNNNGEY